MTATPTAGVLGGAGVLPAKGSGVCVGCGYDLEEASVIVCPACGRARPGAPAASAALGGLVMRGSAWTMGGYAVAQVLRLGSNLALAYLLVNPAFFGLMALVSVFVQGLSMFSDLGIGASIVQNERGEDPKFLNTAWTLQILRGAAIWLCTAILAYPLSLFYNEPMLLWVLPAVGLNVLISGFNSTSLYTLSRRLALGKLTILSLSSQIISMSVTIVWALISPTVWSLVAGGLTSQVVYLIASHAMSGHRDRLEMDRESLRRLANFGQWIFLSTVFTFLVGQGDRLIFGKLMPMNVLGVYSIALMLATFSSQAVFTLGGAVLFPAYSQRVRAGEALGPIFNRARYPLMVLAGYTVAGVVSTGPGFITLLWPSQFSQAAWMVQPLAAAALLQAMECTNGSALLALGQARWVAAGSAAKLVGMAALIPVGHAIWGFEGAVGGLVASEALRYVVSVFAVSRVGLPAFSRDVPILLWAGLTAAAGWFLGPVLRGWGFGGWEQWGVQCAAVTALWAPLLAQQIRRVKGGFGV